MTSILEYNQEEEEKKLRAAEWQIGYDEGCPSLLSLKSCPFFSMPAQTVADAYYGDGCYLSQQCQMAGRPVIIEDVKAIDWKNKYSSLMYLLRNIMKLKGFLNEATIVGQ